MHAVFKRCVFSAVLKRRSVITLSSSFREEECRECGVECIECVEKNLLNVIISLVDGQCMDFRTGVMCSCFLVGD